MAVLLGESPFGPRHCQHHSCTEQTAVECPSSHLLDGGERGLHLYLPLQREGGHVLRLGLRASLVAHAPHRLVVGGGRLGLRAVKVVGEARHVVLLSVLQHVGVECRPYARRDDHAHGEHDAHPCRQKPVGHALVGVHRRERVEQHHARGADDDGPLHVAVQAVGLHLEVHIERRQSYEHEAEGKEPLQMESLGAAQDGQQQTDEVAHQHPVAEGGVLPVVYLHAHTYEDVDKHLARVQDHQSEKQQDASLDALQLEGIEQEVGRPPRVLQIAEDQRRHHAHRRGLTDVGMTVPVEHLAVDHDEDKRAAHHAEHHHVAELGKVDGQPFARVLVVGHGAEDDEDSRQHGRHHEVVHILPLVRVGQPGREPRAHLSQYHEEEVDGGHAGGLLGVELVPSGLVGGLIARCHVDGGLDAKGILDQREKVAHQQRLAYEAHDEAAQGQQEDAVGLGAHITEREEDGEAHDAHHLLATYAHQVVEEGRESGHAHRGDKAYKRYVFCLDAQPAHHLAAVGAVHATDGHDRYEKYHQEDDAEGLGHPVVEREIAWI